MRFNVRVNQPLYLPLVTPKLASSYSKIRCEFPYGKEQNSRVDFLLTGGLERPIYLEVKSVTLPEGKVALFPDTLTTRGQKHLRELTALLPQARAVMLYFVNRGDCTVFAPCDRKGPSLRSSLARGTCPGY